MSQEVDILLELLHEATTLEPSDIYERDRVVEKTQSVIRRVFGEDSVYLQMVGTRNFQSRGSYWSNPFKARQMAFENGKSQLIEALQDMISTLDPDQVFDEVTSSTPEASGYRQVLIAHGPDEEIKHVVVEKLTALEVPFMTVEGVDDLKSLSSQISGISPGDMVLILLTRYDVESVQSDEERNFDEEMEYFLEHLATSHVAIIYQEDSDVEFHLGFAGIGYIPFDTEDQWQFMMVGELESAGFKIDVTKLPD